MRRTTKKSTFLNITIAQLNDAFGYFNINRVVLKEIGLHEAIIYGILCNKHNFYAGVEQLTSNGYFYCTVETLEEETTLTKYQQAKAINNLCRLNFINCQLIGMPAKRYFKVNLNVQIATPEVKSFDNKKSNHLTTRSQIILQQEVKSFDTNKNKYNKNKYNKIDVLRTSSPDFDKSADDDDNQPINKKLKKKDPIKEWHFDYFWNTFPRKAGKGQALTSWNKLCKKKGKPTIGEIITAIQAQIKSEQWQTEQYIPYPVTWLNQSRWLNDPATMVSAWKEETKKIGYHNEKQRFEMKNIIRI